MKGMTQIVEILSALFLTEIVQGILKFEIKEVKQICNLFLHYSTGNLLWQIICQRI